MPILSFVKSRRALRYPILLLSVVLLSVEQTAAQPGDRRSPEQIEKELLESLDKIGQEISHTPSRASLYLGRGNLYLRLYSVTDNLDRSDRYYAEKGLADFATAIESNPQPDVFAARASLHQLIWWIQSLDCSRVAHPRA
jgi:hypothetical protein